MSQALIEAAASYFGMDPKRVDEGGLNVAAKRITVSLRISLTDEDIIGVAARMQALAARMQALAAPSASTWANPPTPVLEKAKADYLGEGVAGRAVEHVDAPTEPEPTEPEPSGLPESVWVPSAHVTHQQASMASDYKGSGDVYLLQVSMLTSVQAQMAVDHDWKRG